MEIKDFGTKIKTGTFSCSLWGIIAAIIIILVTSFIMSCVIFYTSLPESFMRPAVIIISVFALFMGGFIAGRKAQNRGLLHGLLVGLVFVVILLLLTLAQGGSWSSFGIHSAYCLLASVIGGICGVK
ncbi:MAG: TIGR04086 family membrane protein [Bacillota bacterium]